MAKIRVYADEADGEEFPDRCVRCGADAELHVRQRFSWHPPWLIVLVLVSPVIYLIVALILTKRLAVTLPVCRRHRNHWLNRRLFVWLGLLFWVAYAIVVAVLADGLPKDAVPVAIGFGIFGGLGWLVAAVIYQNGGIKPKEISDRYIELVKVDQGFADAWEESNPPPKPRRRARPVRPARRRYEEDEYEDDEYEEDDDDRRDRRRAGR